MSNKCINSGRYSRIYRSQQSAMIMKVLTLIVVLLILLAVLFTGASATLSTCELTEEAELGDTNGDKIHRSKASNKITVRLDDNQYVLWPIVLHSSCFLRVMDVVYTNDGDSDIITVHVNDEHFDSFVTRSRSNYGHLWNQPVSSGELENETKLSAGRHTVKLVATVVDKYEVGLECTDELCPKSAQDDSWNKGHIISIFFGVLSAIIGVSSCLIPIYLGRKNCRCYDVN